MSLGCVLTEVVALRSPGPWGLVSLEGPTKEGAEAWGLERRHYNPPGSIHNPGARDPQDSPPQPPWKILMGAKLRG